MTRSELRYGMKISVFGEDDKSNKIEGIITEISSLSFLVQINGTEYRFRYGDLFNYSGNFRLEERVHGL